MAMARDRDKARARTWLGLVRVRRLEKLELAVY